MPDMERRKFLLNCTAMALVAKSKALTESIRAAEQTVLQRASLWKVNSDEEPVVARTQIQDIAAFYRQGHHGLFASLDFPYSKIAVERTITKISYPPHELLRRSQVCACHSLTLGAI